VCIKEILVTASYLYILSLLTIPFTALYHQLGFKAPFIFCIILAAIDFIMRLLIVERRRNPKEWFEDMDKASAAKSAATRDKKSTTDSAHVPATIAEESTSLEEETTTSTPAVDNKVSIIKLLSHTRMWGALILTFASAIILGALEVIS
jgi:hypothetical protein